MSSPIQVPPLIIADGVSAFETQANDLFDVLKKQNNGVIRDSENGYSVQLN